MKSTLGFANIDCHIDFFTMCTRASTSLSESVILGENQDVEIWGMKNMGEERPIYRKPNAYRRWFSSVILNRQSGTI